MQLLLTDVRICQHLQAHIVKALQRTYTGRTHRNGLTLVSQQTLNGTAVYGNILRMHGMLANGLALHGSERAGTHMQRHLLAFYATRIDVLQHTLSEVQSGCRCRHTALNLRVHRLVRRLVTLLRLTIQIWRNRQLTQQIKDFCKAAATGPFELYQMTRAYFALTCSCNGQWTMFDGQRTLFPLLQVTHQTQPRTAVSLLEHLFVVSRFGRLQQEHLNQSPRMLTVLVSFAEMQTRLNHLRIVHHHQRPLRQMLWQMVEDVLAHYTFIIYKQLRVVAFRHRKFRYPLVRQLIAVIADMYLLCIHVITTHRPHCLQCRSSQLPQSCP